MEAKIDVTEPIGGGNPYSRCVYCGQSVPAISHSGHFKDCPEPGYVKQLAHYRKLLDDLQPKNS